MSRRLETLTPGTPVFCGERRVGSVEGVYSEGESRLAEYLAVRWDSRGATILVPTNDVTSIEEHGVVLEGAEPEKYEASAAFDPQSTPTIKPLA